VSKKHKTKHTKSQTDMLYTVQYGAGVLPPSAEASNMLLF